MLGVVGQAVVHFDYFGDVWHARIAYFNRASIENGIELGSLREVLVD